MNIRPSIFALIIIFFVSCDQKNEKKSVVDNKRDSINNLVNKQELEPLSARRRIEEQEINDRVNDNNVLQDALKFAEQHMAQDTFGKQYVVTVLDSTYIVEVDISKGFYFSSRLSHLMVRRKTPRSVYIDIYSLVGKRFHKKLSHEQWTMEYMGDTIRNINGDGMKDFVVNGMVLRVVV